MCGTVIVIPTTEDNNIMMVDFLVYVNYKFTNLTKSTNLITIISSRTEDLFNFLLQQLVGITKKKKEKME